MCSPVETDDLVPSILDNSKSQAHSRVSECDVQPSVQVKPYPINRLVTASAGVQTDLFATRLNHKLQCMYLQSQTDMLGT